MKRAVFVLSMLGLGCGASSRASRPVTFVDAPAARTRVYLEESTPTEPVATSAVSDAAAPAPSPWGDPRATLGAAAAQAEPGPRRVLEAAGAMIDGGVVLRGSCYTWVRGVYRRALGRSFDVFQGDRRARFADGTQLRPGDWVFFINHSFGDVTHSAIFVGWVDPGARVAMMMSYPGGNRDAPGRFGDYELSNVYRIVRMGDDPAGRPRDP